MTDFRLFILAVASGLALGILVSVNSGESPFLPVFPIEAVVGGFLLVWTFGMAVRKSR